MRQVSHFSTPFFQNAAIKSKGIKFRSLTEAIDTETPTGRAMWQMIGVLAELEWSLIVERTRAV